MSASAHFVFLIGSRRTTGLSNLNSLPDVKDLYADRQPVDPQAPRQ
jgi:hypothetical protein